MRPPVLVSHVGKSFRRYQVDRPGTIQQAVAQGLRGMRHVERFWGLRDVTFRVEAGQAMGIIGANGSGKSTLLRLVGKVGRPDEGRIEVMGRVGALLDLGAGFHPDLNGWENAILSGVINGLTRKQVLDRLDAMVAFAEIGQAMENPIRTFSSGMQMRLAFSIAVHTEPSVLLIDEVLSVGDLAFQHKCLQRLNEIKALGCSILLVSHEPKTIEDFCDEAIWLSDGRLIVQGHASDVMRHYAEHMAGAGTP